MYAPIKGILVINVKDKNVKYTPTSSINNLSAFIYFLFIYSNIVLPTMYFASITNINKNAIYAISIGSVITYNPKKLNSNKNTESTGKAGKRGPGLQQGR